MKYFIGRFLLVAAELSWRLNVLRLTLIEIRLDRLAKKATRLHERARKLAHKI